MSYRIALAGEAHTVAETLLKKSAVEVAPCVLGEETRKKLETGQLSNKLLNLAFKICQQARKNNRRPDLNPVLLFRCKLTNQQTCQG